MSLVSVRAWWGSLRGGLSPVAALTETAAGESQTRKQNKVSERSYRKKLQQEVTERDSRQLYCNGTTTRGSNWIAKKKSVILRWVWLY